jgi:hypothetical protein
MSGDLPRSLVPPQLRFLHSMRTRGFLESALADGLMYTDQDVRFSPAETSEQWEELLSDVNPRLMQRLELIGSPWSEIPEDGRALIMRGLGSISGSIPMLCFTEVPEGRDLPAHHLLFGGYGVVVRREWLGLSGGDRVLYIGNNSPVSRRLFGIVASLQIAHLSRGPAGNLIFGTPPTALVLDLFTYVQVRKNLEEFEWRIAGRHGFTGGARDTGKRLSLPMDQIEMVLVQNLSDVKPIEALVGEIAARQSATSMPRVLCQPAVLNDP